MSREVDERVVEMRFDNAQFEKNVKQSRESLEKLNRSLQLDGAEKGFEKIADASAKVDFDEMQGAVETLSDKFSAMEVIGVAALVKITNQAIDTGEKLVKSLSIDQVTSGWNKYAQKTASVQTIMNATGKSITKVNSYLDKLMWYSDETSYGFTDMTNALSTLTASGGDIDKMIPMIMGMANATAYAGKGAAEFQHVIYNLSQSYGAGALQLLDWKSVENANVSSEQLKQTIIDTAVELGKIKKGEITTGTFDNSLQKKWADREVMEKSFAKFSALTEAAYKAVQAGEYDSASEAIEHLSKDYDELSVKAFKSAQSAKSFTDAIEATKDAVSSKWMDTFDIIFGNYKEAEAFWTDVANTLYDIFAVGGDTRNSWLKSAFDSGLDQLLGTEGFGDAADNYTNLLQKALMNVGLVTEDDIEAAGSFQKALEGSGVTAQQLYAIVDSGAEAYSSLLEKSDAEIAAAGGTREEVEKLYNAYKALKDKALDGSVSLDDLAGKMDQLSGREHFFNGILNILEGINSVLEPIRNAFSDVFMTDGSPLYNLLKGFDELTGKLVISEDTAEKVQKVFRGLFSVLDVGFKGIKVVVKTAFTVLQQVLDILSPIGDVLLNIASYLGNVLTWVDLSLGQAESFSDVLMILATAVGGLVSPIRELWQGFVAFVRGGDVEEAKTQFSAFGVVVNAAGSVLNKFTAGSETAGNIIGTVFQALGGVLLAAFDGVGALIGNAFGGLQDAGDTVGEFAQSKVPVLENIRDAVVSLPQKAEEALKNFGGTLGNVMSVIAAACKTALDAVVKFFNLQNGVDLYRLLALIDVGALALGIGFVAKALNAVSTATKNLLKNPVTNFFDALTGAVNNWTKAHTTNNLVTAAKGIATAVALISGSVYLLSRIEDPEAGLEAMKMVLISIMSMLLSMKVLAATDLGGLDTGKMVASVLALSAGVGAMAAAVTKVGSMHTYQVENGIEAISRLCSMLAGMVGLLSVYNGKLGGTKGAGGFVAAAAAVDIVALALIPLAKAAENGLDIEAAADVMKGISIALAALMVASGTAQQLAGKSDKKALDKAIAFAAKMGTLVLAVNGMASALLITAGAVGAFAAMGDRMWTALAGAGAALAGLAAAAGILGHMDLKGVKKSAKAMAIMAAALAAAAGAVAIFVKIADMDDGQGFTGALLALIILGTAVGVIGKMKGDAFKAAEAMTLISASLVLFAAAIEMMGTTGVEKGLSGCVSAIAALTVLGAAMVLLPDMGKKLENIGSAALKLSAALLVLAPAMLLLGQLDFQHAVAGVIALVGLVGSLIVSSLMFGAIKPMADGIKVLTGVLTDLAKAFSIFAGGALKLGLAVGVIAILSKFAGPICEAITTAAPDIEAALVQIIMTISNAIVEGMPYIAAALVAILAGIAQVLVEGAPYIVMILVEILAILEDTIVQCIGLLWDNNGAGGGIKGKLEKLWDLIYKFFAGKSTEFPPLYMWLFGNVAYDDPSLVNDPVKRVLNSRQKAVDGVLEENQKQLANSPIGQLFGGNKSNFSGMGGGSFGNGGGAGRTRATQADTDAKNQNALATKKQADAANAYGTAARKSAEETRNATEAVNIATKATQDVEKATVEVTDANGNVYRVTTEQAAAMLGSQDAMASLAGAQRDAGNAVEGTTGSVNESAAAVTAYAGKTANVVTAIDQTKKTVKDSEGAVKEQVETTVDHATAGIITIADKNGSDAGAAMKSGFLGSLETGIDEIWSAMTGGKSFDFGAAINNMAGGLSSALDKDNILNGLKGVQDKIGLTTQDWYSQLTGNQNGSGSSGTGTGTGKSSGTKKTVAQQIEEKYKTQLEANKTLREIADNEYELWLAENENTASADELLAKRTENAAAEIANQTDRVAIAQAKYDEMTKRWGADKQETKEAYNDLLQEQTSLAKLKADQYTNLFEQITKRYDTDLDTLEKEYNLWTAQTDGTVSDLDKIDRETQYMKDELEVKLKKEAKAKEQYDILKKELGEANLETQEAYNDWLDAQTESLELQNEIAKQGLEKLDKKLEQISDAQSRMKSRMDLLSSIYDDGSLSDRADAYKEAVETYGENSAEAQKAKFQGITTSILGTVSALQSMTSELQTTYELQKLLYDGLDANGNKVELSEEDRKTYEDKLLSSRSALVGFAGNLADAMDLDDTGKKLVIKLANAIQKNWSKIRDGMNAAFDKATEKMDPTVVDNLKKLFGTLFSDEGVEIGTEFLSAITSAMQGDYAGALVSAATGIIDLMSTDAGKQLTENLTNAMAMLLPNLQNGTNQIVSAFCKVGEAVNGAGGLAGIFGSLTTQGAGAASALGGIGEAMAGLGTAIVGVLPELLIVVGIIAAIAALFAGIASFIGWKKSQNQTKSVTKDIGAEIDKGISDGVKEDGPVIGDAVDDVTEDALTVAKNTLSAVSRVLDSDYEYEPQITPVVDLTNVVEGAEEIDSTFAATKSLCLDGDVSRNLANQIDAEVQLQNGLKNRSSDDTLAAINALGGHMDGVAESIRGMKLTINGRKTIGYIDDRMGRLAGAKV